LACFPASDQPAVPERTPQANRIREADIFKAVTVCSSRLYSWEAFTQKITRELGAYSQEDRVMVWRVLQNPIGLKNYQRRMAEALGLDLYPIQLKYVRLLEDHFRGWGATIS
jgi:hypothetical protein